VTLKTISLVLGAEDENCGYKHVKGIGQWPKLVSGNLLSIPRAGT